MKQAREPNGNFMPIYKDNKERILSNIVVDKNKCWIWQQKLNHDGYGHIWYFTDDGKHRATSAHRLSYITFNGPIPDGYHVDHLCRVRSCANPEHLEAVTPTVNTYRSFAPAAINKRKTHCNHGHEFTPDNTVIRLVNGKEKRRCVMCTRENGLRKYRRMLAKDGKVPRHYNWRGGVINRDTPHHKTPGVVDSL